MENNFNPNENTGFTQQPNQQYQPPYGQPNQQPYQPQYQPQYQPPNQQYQQQYQQQYKQPYQPQYKPPKQQSPLIKMEKKDIPMFIIVAVSVLLMGLFSGIYSNITSIISDNLSFRIGSIITSIIYALLFIIAPVVVGFIMGLAKKDYTKSMVYVISVIGGHSLAQFIAYPISSILYSILFELFRYNYRVIYFIITLLLSLITGVIGCLVAMLVCKFLIDDSSASYSLDVANKSSIFAAVIAFLFSAIKVLEIIVNSTMRYGIFTNYIKFILMLILTVAIIIGFGLIAKNNFSKGNIILILSTALVGNRIYNFVLELAFGITLFNKIILGIFAAIIGAAASFVIITVYCKEKMKLSEANNKTEAVNS